jgi:hypothetical protein
VRCERRDDRSRASVDGNNLPSGTYRARLVSGSSEALSAPRSTVGDEVEFDFDSNSGEGGTRIASTFLQGNPPRALGQILDAQGAVVVASEVTCELD